MTHLRTFGVPRGPQRTNMCANKALLEPWKVPYIWSKLHCTCGDHPAGAFWTKSSHVGPSDDLFRDQKARFRTYWGLKRALFAHIMAFFDTLGGLQSSGNGSVMPTLLAWVSWTILWCLEPNPAPCKTSRGAKSALWGSNRPQFDHL